METHTQLIFICGIIIIAYLIEVLARRSKLPAVLFLIIFGIILRQVNDHFQLINFDFKIIIPALGTFGLILIVFEGALELDYQKQKNRIIRRAFLSSMLILFATTAAITFALLEITDQSIRSCFINAIPLSIISSAIAIPSVLQMSGETREFITYESTFSDILGIILFNYAILFSDVNFQLLATLGIELLLVMLLSLTVCILLLFLLKSITHNIKFIMIITVMVFMYAVGKYFHLSSLILVLVFGLFLRNLHLIQWPVFQRYLTYEHFNRDFKFLHQITAEGVFLIKTFFFVIFGFIIDFAELNNVKTFVTSLLVITIIYLVRAPLIRLINGRFSPEAYISPRGLITVLLYLSMPEEFRVPEVSTALLFLVVLMTGFMMVLGRKGIKSESGFRDA